MEDDLVRVLNSDAVDALANFVTITGVPLALYLWQRPAAFLKVESDGITSTVFDVDVVDGPESLVKVRSADSQRTFKVIVESGFARVQQIRVGLGPERLGQLVFRKEEAIEYLNLRTVDDGKSFLGVTMATNTLISGTAPDVDQDLKVSIWYRNSGLRGLLGKDAELNFTIVSSR